MSGWRPDSPVELADGTACCQAHHLIICGICCADYSFMQEMSDCDADEIPDPLNSDADDVSDDEDSSDSDSDDSPAEFRFVENKPIDFTPATRFNPPNPDDTPKSLFTAGNTRHVNVTGGRFIRHTNPRQILFYTDGACLDNGNNGAIGGCAFVFKGGKSPAEIKNGVTSFRLEDRGPSGIAYPHTGNRAELRAVIGALQFRAWNGEGYNELVIATDSEYVAKGATEWVVGWVKRGWRTSAGKEVKNRDLWEFLFKEIQKFRDSQWRPLCVMFWRIPRALNTVADQAAKEAAATGERRDSFGKIFGVLV